MGISADKNRIVIVVNKTTKAKLEELAKKDARSLSNYLNLVLENYCKENQ